LDCENFTDSESQIITYQKDDFDCKSLGAKVTVDTKRVDIPGMGAKIFLNFYIFLTEKVYIFCVKIFWLLNMLFKRSPARFWSSL